MRLSGELAPLGYAHRQSEFVIPSGATTRVFGACGPTALAACASAALGAPHTAEDTVALLERHGYCDSQGVSNDGKLAQAALLYGLAISEHHAYGGDQWSAWPNFLGYHCGTRSDPVLLEVANGQALHDAISGLGENATGLRYHFIAFLKRHPGGHSAYAGRDLSAGYWCCDGASYAGGNDRAHAFAAADVLQFYSDAALAAALPCAAIAFARSVTGGPADMWKVVSPGVVADSTGVQAKFAMAAYIEQHLDLGDVVSGCPGETYIDDGQTSVLPLQGATSLVYTKAAGVATPDLTGKVLWTLHQQLVAANAEIAALKAAPLAPAPAPDPRAAVALAAIEALKMALSS